MLRFPQTACLLLLALVLAPSAHAQALSKRLILKDGSYQAATKWEVKGDRVRYYSAERYDWEELPNSLIDWPATEKYNKERAAGAVTERTREVDAEEIAERRAEEARSPQVVPGLRLPPTGGVFMLDYYRDQPELIELVQNGAEINANTGKNILRAAINPLASNKRTVELKGLHARIQAHVPQPVIYLNVDQDQDPKTGPTPQDETQHYKIVRAQGKKDVRVVGAINRSVLGKVGQQADAIDARVEPVSGGWIKVIPAVQLTPGEYALVEMLGKDMNLYVWDFGINPSAPENPSTWKPAPVPENKTGTKESPILNNRKQP